MEDIRKLKTRRFNLREKIRKYVKEGKNAKHLVIEYQELIKKLNELGIRAESGKDYLQLDYWEDYPDPSTTKKEKQDTQTILKNNPEKSNLSAKNSYVLCLAWPQIGSSIPSQVKKVKDYFEELCLKVVGEDKRYVNESTTEYILKYGFEGTEDAFRMLKLCTQFVLDSFAESDFDKFNIAVYGKKIGK